jgi:hypothetical protein
MPAVVVDCHSEHKERGGHIFEKKIFSYTAVNCNDYCYGRMF